MITGRTHLKETVVATIKFSRSLNLYSLFYYTSSLSSSVRVASVNSLISEATG